MFHFRKKKKCSLCNKKSRDTTASQKNPGSLLLFILLVSMCVPYVHMYGSGITCSLTKSRGRERTISSTCGSSEKSELCLRSILSPTPRRLTGARWHACLYTNTDRGSGTNMTSYLHSGFIQSDGEEGRPLNKMQSSSKKENVLLG